VYTQKGKLNLSLCYVIVNLNRTVQFRHERPVLALYVNTQSNKTETDSFSLFAHLCWRPRAGCLPGTRVQFQSTVSALRRDRNNERLLLFAMTIDRPTADRPLFVYMAGAAPEFRKGGSLSAPIDGNWGPRAVPELVVETMSFFISFFMP